MAFVTGGLRIHLGRQAPDSIIDRGFFGVYIIRFPWTLDIAQMMLMHRASNTIRPYQTLTQAAHSVFGAVTRSPNRR